MITTETKVIDRGMQALVNRLENPAYFLRLCGPRVFRDCRDHILKSQAPWGSYTPDKPATLARRSKGHANRRKSVSILPLVDTGALLNSLKWRMGNNQLIMAAGGALAPYASVHNGPSYTTAKTPGKTANNIPYRPYLYISLDLMIQLDRAFARYLVYGAPGI
jgi:phage gpG-like protein